MIHDLPWIEHRDQVWGGKTYAQHGDDIIMLCIFHQLKIYGASWLDIGAHHPFHLSNTALFYQRGGRGINVEPNPDLMKEFRKHRPEDINLCAGVGAKSGSRPFFCTNAPGLSSFDYGLASSYGIVSEIDVPVITVEEIINQHRNGIFPDMLTIDAEGLDMEILGSINWSGSTPKVVCAEAFTADRDVSSELKILMIDKGYFLHSWAVNNMIFARLDLHDRLCG